MRLILVLMFLSLYGIAEEKLACPVPDLSLDKVTVREALEGEKPVDLNQDFKDLGTKIVVKNFFTSPDTLFNYMKLVYETIDQALTEYKNERGLKDNSIILIFKGGNIMRMIANELFKILPPLARNLLESKYAQFYERSDTDFSVYVDDKKLLALDYETVLGEVTNLVLSKLNDIREEFKAHPQKYFNFLQLRADNAGKALEPFFKELEEINAIKDEANDKWYKARFKQLQILNARAQADLLCRYFGQYDYKYEIKDNQIVTTRTSRMPNWIVNTDNRTIESRWGTDASKIIKFFLVRSKIAFEYTYEKDGIWHRKPIGGELIDVSLPHRKDANFKDFFNNYDKNIATYILTSEDGKDKLVVKSYSPAYLAQDIQYIIFDQFDRPWHSGGKYEKRLNRFFFFSIIELLNDYGLGSKDAQVYIEKVKEKIIKPLYSLYPLDETSSKKVDEVIENINLIVHEYGRNMAVTNKFWQALGKFVQTQLLKSLQADDKEQFMKFLDIIDENLNVAFQLGDMPKTKIPLNEIFTVEMSSFL